MDKMYANESFLRYLDNSQVENVSPGSEKTLRGPKKIIESYRNLLVHSNFSSERADMLSINGVEHYKGTHANYSQAPYKPRVDEVMDLLVQHMNATGGAKHHINIFVFVLVKLST